LVCTSPAHICAGTGFVSTAWLPPPPTNAPEFDVPSEVILMIIIRTIAES
jgi:hypothetical protein